MIIKVIPQTTGHTSNTPTTMKYDVFIYFLTTISGFLITNKQTNKKRIRKTTSQLVDEKIHPVQSGNGNKKKNFAQVSSFGANQIHRIYLMFVYENFYKTKIGMDKRERERTDNN